MPDAAPPLSQRVLVIGPSNVGDAILIGDVVTRLRDRFPGAHMTVVVGERARLVFADDPRIQTLVDASHYDSWLGRLQLAVALWRYRPHVVVDLRHTAYPFLLKPLTAWRYLRQPPRRLIHMRQRHLWKLRVQVPRHGAGQAEAPVTEALWFSPKDLAHVESLRRRWALDPARRLVVVCPGARSHIKRWTAEGFAGVADRLIAEDHADIVFCGEPEEKAIIEEISGLMRQRAHSAVGLTTVRQVAALMRGADLVITNDSASLHAASAMDVPTVAIFGPTHAGKYGPTAARQRVVRRQLFCSPCEQAQCRFNHECMRFIAPDEVHAAARALLGDTAGSRHA